MADITDSYEFVEYPMNAEQGGRVAAALERIADVQEGKTSGMSTLEQQIASSFAVARTGKVYRTRFYKYATNTTTAGTKMDDNAGLVCEPSTDTTEGQDDYADLPFNKWIKCNYKRDSDGFARPTVLEDWPGYAKSGAVDVGVLHPTIWVAIKNTATYQDVIVSDSPHAELGLAPFCDSVKADGTVMPYFIQSATASGMASDGLLRSQPELAPAYNQSFNSMITDYKKKGDGYQGAGQSRNLFGYLMYMIKYAYKSSQKVFAGCSIYNAQVKCAVAETGVKRVLVSSADPWYVGGCVSVGVADGTNIDRGISTMHSVCDRVRIKSIETVTVNSTQYTALNLDIDSTINTTTDMYVTSMPCWTGETDAVIGHHDGSFMSNTDGHHTFRINGQEYMNGQYVVASDTVIVFSDANGYKDVYVYPKGTTHVANSYANAVKVASIPVTGDYWIGDEQFILAYGAMVPGAKGSGDSVGAGDYTYGGGTPSAGSTREYLQNADLWHGSAAGLCHVNCGYGLGYGHWSYASCD